MTRTLRTMKRISLPKILLLMHHQVRPNPLRHSPRRTRTVVLAEENPNNKAKTKILLPLALMPPSLGRIKTRTKTRKTYLTLSATLVSRKVIMLIIVRKKAKKLVSVLTISTSVTKDSEEAIVSTKELEQVICI